MQDTKSQQAKRIVFMLKKLLNGYKLSTYEMYRLVENNFGELSLRSVQRDLRVLQESEETIETYNEGKTVIYYIPRMTRPGAPVNIGGTDLLSLHILKAHLKTFKGTMIESNTQDLESKLEELAPANAYASDSMYWNKNIGQYDYSAYDKILLQIFHYISERRWVKIGYRPLRNLKKTEEYICIFKSIFTYFGYLYVAAFDAKHKKYVVFAVHRIESIEQYDDIPRVRVPKFNYEAFIKNRFGVYDGKPKRVELYVSEEYTHYFVGRFWHNSQVIKKNKDGSLTIRLNVPIVPDFISWLLSWGDAVKVKSPRTLQKQLVDKAKDIIDLYK
jgi:predicted DNA-binding transcriptional regulator YafY